MLEASTPRPASWLTTDFGKYGRKVRVGRFPQHAAEDLIGRQVVGGLNFAPRQISDVLSEVLILGVQFPGAAGGEATILVPAQEAKIGGKVF